MNRETKRLKMKDGTELSVSVAEVGSPVWVVVTHGVGEHYERHNYISDLLGQHFNILHYDLRNHGESGGEKGSCENFQNYVDDLYCLVDFLRSEYRLKRLILFGHSMGALITCATIQQNHDKLPELERVVVNAPPVGFPPPFGPLIKFTSGGFWKKAAALRGELKLGGLVDLKYLSHDPQVEIDYRNDEKNSLKLGTTLLFGIVDMSKQTFSKPLRSPCPGFVSYGTEDRVVDTDAIQKYFTMVDKGFRIKTIEGSYHEVHNEIDKYRKPYFEYLKETFLDCLYKEKA